MSTLFAKALQLLVGSGTIQLPLLRSGQRPLRDLTERQLIQLESEIGRTLFGPVPKGHRREFFNLDSTTWIWHEQWRDDYGQPHEMTTRYEVHERGILKVQPGPTYTDVGGQELENLRVAAEMYHEKVMRDIYGRNHRTGKKLL